MKMMCTVSVVSQKSNVKHEVVWPTASQKSDEGGVLPMVLSVGGLPPWMRSKLEYGEWLPCCYYELGGLQLCTQTGREGGNAEVSHVDRRC